MTSTLLYPKTKANAFESNTSPKRKCYAGLILFCNFSESELRERRSFHNIDGPGSIYGAEYPVANFFGSCESICI